MSDETLDSGNANGGTPAQPNAGGSQGQSDSNGSSASPSQSDLEKRLAYLETQYNALKSEKDRGISKVEKKVDSFEKKFAEVQLLMKERGISQDEALDRIRLRDEIDDLKAQIGGSTAARPSPVGNGAGEAVDKAKVLAQYGLNENDPDVAAQLQSESDVEKVALRVAFKRSQKQPDPAAAPATSASTQATNQGDLQAQYQKRLADMRAAGRPSPMQIADLKAEYRKKGLDIW